MDSVRLYFKVQDFRKWKGYFDEDVRSGLLARDAGVTKYDLQQIVDTGELSLYFELKDANKFKDFLKSEKCQTRVKEAGVTGDIRAVYMKRLEEKNLGEGVKAA